MMATIRRLVQFVAGSVLVILPSCGGRKEVPPEASAEPTAPFPSPGAPPAAPHRRVPPLSAPDDVEPGPLPDDLTLDFSTAHDADPEALDAGQRALLDAWRIREGGEQADRRAVYGQGDWVLSAGEMKQPFTDEVRFFRFGGHYAGGHAFYRPQIGMLHRGHVRFRMGDTRYPGVVGCHVDRPAEEKIIQARAVEAGWEWEAVMEAEDALVTKHCVDYTPLLRDGLLRRLSEGHDPVGEVIAFVNLVAVLQDGHGSAGVERPEPPGEDGQPRGGPSVTWDGATLKASGIVHTTDPALSQSHRFVLEVDADTMKLDLATFENRPQIPY